MKISQHLILHDFEDLFVIIKFLVKIPLIIKCVVENDLIFIFF